MSGDLTTFLVAECLKRSEPCIPIEGGESWYSVAFVAAVAGYENVKYFRERLNQAGIPRHPFQRDCIRFSDLGLIETEGRGE